MAEKSKSQEPKEEISEAEESQSTDGHEGDSSVSPESSEGTPIIIESEAVETPVEQNEELYEQGSEEVVETTLLGDEQGQNPPDAHAVQSEAKSGGGMAFVPLLLGGLVAGAIGFGAANFVAPPVSEFDATELISEIERNSATAQALSEDVSALREAPTLDPSAIEARLVESGERLSSLQDDLGSVGQRLDELAASFEEQLLGLDGRILALETAVPSASALASDDELAALRERIETMTSEAQSQLAIAEEQAQQIARAAEEARLSAEAEAAEMAAAAEERERELLVLAARQEQLLELRSAVESGAEYTDLLNGIEELPEVLQMNAADGLPTVQTLQQSFPAAARSALAQSPVVAQDATTGERLADFLRRRTNARSLTPQEGNSVDAVLSRAEASLGDGDLTAALNELEALPDGAKDALSEWIAQAEARLSAISALDDVTATN